MQMEKCNFNFAPFSLKKKKKNIYPGQCKQFDFIAKMA